ncbi:bifunctional pantoate--beta-alanine ligase/(d)CMP kinase [Leptolyngbya sp. FACHB-321]|nr:bifunctional pantoate--beta-alanine ligase/(d)CMP kinase [Leptolyngbya sp. FACHB-321]
MRLFKTVAGLRCYLNRYRSGQHLSSDRTNVDPSVIGEPISAAGVSIGLVPTMGSLHVGHLSLIQKARQENQLVVVSIFVNPLQFGPTEDFQQYPRTLEQDQALCEQAGVDVIFAPSAGEMGVGSRESGVESRELEHKRFPSGTSRASEIPKTTQHPQLNAQNASPLLLTPYSSPTQVVPPEAMLSVLCGRSRVGHFQGVATIVTKLLNIVQPQRAYFGQKDAQQLTIIRRLVEDLNLPVAIVGCPIVREPSGLAYSSRNQYLTPEQKAQAAALYRGLSQAEQAFRAGERSVEALLKTVQAILEPVTAIVPEYIELVHPSTLEPLEMIEESGLLAIAGRLGSTRLIDNMLLSSRKPIVAIDGPAGAGKSTVSRQVAQRLDLLYLDTGAMYRALTWLVLESGVAIDDEPSIAELASQCEIELDAQLTPIEKQSRAINVSVNGQDVTQAIRSLEVTSKVSAIAAQPIVRNELVRQQRRYGKNGGIVIDGRDIGTYVFPDAELKLFLTASVQERARRRQQDLKNQGKDIISLDELEQAIYDRDLKDSTRALAPLRQAEDAIEIQTDNLSIAEVVDRIVQLYQERAIINA